MNKFLTFFGSKHSPFDQSDGALNPRLSDAGSDGEIGGDDSGGESGDDARDLSAPHVDTAAAYNLNQKDAKRVKDAVAKKN